MIFYRSQIAVCRSIIYIGQQRKKTVEGWDQIGLKLSWICWQNVGIHILKIVFILKPQLKNWGEKRSCVDNRLKPAFRPSTCSARRVCPGRHSSQNPSLYPLHYDWFCVQLTAHHGWLKSKANIDFALRLVHHDIFGASQFRQKLSLHVMLLICRDLSKSKIRMIVAPFSPHLPITEKAICSLSILIFLVLKLFYFFKIIYCFSATIVV